MSIMWSRTHNYKLSTLRALNRSYPNKSFLRIYLKELEIQTNIYIHNFDQSIIYNSRYFEQLKCA